MATKQKSIELILLRQFSSYLGIPTFIIDTHGNLIFCNEKAENLLGFRFSETGEMPEEEWYTIFTPQDENGQTLPKESLLLHAAYSESRIAHNTFYIRSLDNVLLHIRIVTMPIINLIEDLYGAVSFFQEIH